MHVLGVVCSKYDCVLKSSKKENIEYFQCYVCFGCVYVDGVALATSDMEPYVDDHGRKMDASVAPNVKRMSRSTSVLSTDEDSDSAESIISDTQWESGTGGRKKQDRDLNEVLVMLRLRPQVDTNQLYSAFARGGLKQLEDEARRARHIGVGQRRTRSSTKKEARGAQRENDVVPDTRNSEAPLPVPGAALMDTRSTTPLGKAQLLQGAMDHTVANGFLQWTENMCHFDTFAILQLAAWSILGKQFWETSDVQRELSRNEQWLLDLLCSTQYSTKEQMSYLRLVYMYDALKEKMLYGENVDLMVHGHAAQDGVKEAYHSISREVTCSFTEACECAGHERWEASTVNGALPLWSPVVHDDARWQCDDVESAVRHSLLRDTACDMECNGYRCDSSMECPGRFRYECKTIQLGSLLVLAPEPLYKPKIQMQITIMSHTFHLVGIGIYTTRHYVARFRRSIHVSTWLDYNDLLHDGAVVRSNENPLDNPPRYNGKSATIRGLWYVNVANKGQPVDVSGLSQWMRDSRAST